MERLICRLLKVNVIQLLKLTLVYYLYAQSMEEINISNQPWIDKIGHLKGISTIGARVGDCDFHIIIIIRQVGIVH